MDGTRDRGGDGRTDMRRTAIGSAADRACDHLIAAGRCPWGVLCPFQLLAASSWRDLVLRRVVTTRPGQAIQVLHRSAGAKAILVRRWANVVVPPGIITGQVCPLLAYTVRCEEARGDSAD
jgi:hypothetical protein